MIDRLDRTEGSWTPDSMDTRRLAPKDDVFVGRSRELRKLDGAFDAARNGRLGVVLIDGDAGSGKTALVRHWLSTREAARGSFKFCSGTCNSQSGPGEPYSPFRQALRELLLGKEEVAEPGERRAITVANVAKGVLKSLVTCAPDLIGCMVPGGNIVGGAIQSLVAELSGDQGKASAADAGPKGELQEGRLVEQYASFLRDLSKDMPLVLFLDDMHWCDAASANLLLQLLRQLEKSSVVLVCAYRSVLVQGGRSDAKHPLETVATEAKRIHGDVKLDLDSVPEEERRALVDGILDAEPNRFGAEFRARLFRHTEGHPLFTTELLRKLKEDGSLRQAGDGSWEESAKIDWEEIPAKMEGVVEGRLAMLDESLRQSLAVASVQGTQFILQVVSRIQQSNERDTLTKWGNELQKRQHLINEIRTTRRGQSILSLYRFAGPVYQQYLYCQLGSGERMVLHGEVAAALESIFGESDPEIIFDLARHYDLACIPEKAVPLLLNAGKIALGMGAYTEAKLHLERADELMAQLVEGEKRSRPKGTGPDGEDERRRTLQAEISINLSHVARVVEGWNSPKAKELYDQVLRLCPEAEDHKAVVMARFGKWACKLTNAELAQALKQAEEMRAYSRAVEDPVVKIVADTAYGNTLFWLGDQQGLDRVLGPLLERMETVFPLEGGGELIEGGFEAYVLPAQFGSWSMALRGRWEAAETLCLRSIQRAESIEHAYSQALSYTSAAFLYAFADRHQQVLEFGERLIEVSRKNQFDVYLGLGKVCQGWALVRTGEATSVDPIDVGYELWQRYAGPFTSTFKHLLKADALAFLGRRDESCTELQCGLEFAERTGEQALSGLLMSRLAQNHIDSGRAGEAALLFQKALELAVRQGADLVRDQAERGLEAARQGAEAG